MAEFKKAVSKVRRRTAASLRTKKAEKEFKREKKAEVPEDSEYDFSEFN